MSIDLKPCPFCGGNATVSDGRGCRAPRYAVGCKKCSFELWPHDDRDAVIATWNTRATPTKEAWGDLAYQNPVNIDNGASA